MAKLCLQVYEFAMWLCFVFVHGWNFVAFCCVGVAVFVYVREL